MSRRDISITVKSNTGAGAEYSIESNGEQVSGGNNVGIHVVLFNPTNGRTIGVKTFYKFESNPSKGAGNVYQGCSNR